MGRLYEADPATLHGSKSARMLQSIRRDMDLKDEVFRRRRRNEEVLSLAYQDGTMLGGESEAKNLRENSLNLPYRQQRWIESQATSKRMIVKVSRDAGEGQRPGGPGDNETGMWTAVTLGRVAYEGGFDRETKALIGEVMPRGTSVIRIGYHKVAITAQESRESGKDAQSVVADVMAKGDIEAKPGQAHEEISDGLAAMAEDPMVQAQVGTEGVGAIVARKASHDEAAYKEETQQHPIESVRMIRHKVWMQKLRVGEDCGWAPWVYDTEDTPFWWQRHVSTVAEVKASEMFALWFKAKVKGYDGRNVSGVMRSGKTPSSDSMSSDGRIAQSEDVLDDDERLVEWFEVFCRRPEMRSGGLRKIVSAEFPEKFCEASDENPYTFPEGTPDAGANSIPNFYPFFDFTPVLSSLTVPDRATGIPPIAVGMPHFERIAEMRRLTHESGLRHSLRLYEIDPAVKNKADVQNALRNGTDGYSFVADQAQVGMDGRLRPGVVPIQFSGNTMEVDRLEQNEKSAWVMVSGMPPSVLQGVGTAGTLGQDNIGLAAGERESGALVGYFEKRMADVLAGMRGLIRANYDDEDFIRLLGDEGAAVMKAWQQGSVDDGDTIEVTFGERAQAERTVRTKQIMEAITAEASQVDPVTGLPKYDPTPLFEELHRMLDVGAPRLNPAVTDMMTKLALLGKRVLEAQAQQGGTSATGAPPSGSTTASSGGPNPSEGEGPQEGTLAAGASRGTFPVSAGGQP